MNSRKKLFKKTQKYWGALPLGYFEIASQGIRSILRKDNLGKLIFESNNETREVFMLQDAATLYASIYNLKHAIELSVKALEVSIENTYTSGHDFEKQITELRGKFENHCISELFDFYQMLVLKYSKFDFANSQTSDESNEIFRYTETLSGKSLDYSKVHQLSKNDLDEILYDISDLKKVFELLIEQFNLFKSHYGFGMGYDQIRENLLNIPTISNPGFKNIFSYKST